MAQKSITEYQAKNIIKHNWKRYFSDFELLSDSVEVDTTNADWEKLLLNQDILNSSSVVVKPDMLFGKRAKNNLVYLKDKDYGDIDIKKAIQWIKGISSTNTKVFSKFKQDGTPLTDDFKEGILTRFIVENFNKVDSPEYYLSFQTDYDGDIIYFSELGGVDIEENWDQVVKTVKVSLDKENLETELDNLTQNQEMKVLIEAFYKMFADLNFSYLEFNPFKVENNKIYLLDTVAKLDSVASFQMQKCWGNIDFLSSFGSNFETDEVKNIQKLDSKSGASLKLTLLNPDGNIWLLLAGGGASVVTMDSFTKYLSDPKNIANYGEYSGNPSKGETMEYTKNVLNLMFKSRSKQKILFISGAIANFTDIKQTFLGIHQALQEKVEQFKSEKVKIYIRRGGPNYKAGLALLKNFAQENGLDAEVYGPEIGLSEICQKIVKDNKL